MTKKQDVYRKLARRYSDPRNPERIARTVPGKHADENTIRAIMKTENDQAYRPIEVARLLEKELSDKQVSTLANTLTKLITSKQEPGIPGTRGRRLGSIWKSCLDPTDLEIWRMSEHEKRVARELQARENARKAKEEREEKARQRDMLKTKKLIRFCLVLFLGIFLSNSTLVLQAKRPGFTEILSMGTPSEIFDYMAGRHPQNHKDMYNWAVGAYRLKDYQRSKSLTHQLLSEVPNGLLAAKAWYHLGNVSEAEGDFEQALNHYDAARNLSPDPELNFIVWQRIAKIFVDMEKWEAARNALVRARDVGEQERSDYWGAYWRIVTRYHDRMGELEEGLESANKALSFYPPGSLAFADINLYRAFFYSQMGDPARGYKLAKESLIFFTKNGFERNEAYAHLVLLYVEDALNVSPDLTALSRIEEWAKIHRDVTLLTRISEYKEFVSLENTE